jgi:hypothetical protein
MFVNILRGLRESICPGGEKWLLYLGRILSGEELERVLIQMMMMMLGYESMHSTASA